MLALFLTVCEIFTFEKYKYFKNYIRLNNNVVLQCDEWSGTFHNTCLANLTMLTVSWYSGTTTVYKGTMCESVHSVYRCVYNLVYRVYVTCVECRAIERRRNITQEHDY